MSYNLSPITGHSVSSWLNRSSSIDAAIHSNFEASRRRDESFSIGQRSSFKNSDRVGDRKGQDFYQFKLSRFSRVQIRVTNREFLFGPSVKVQLEKRSSSSRITRFALPGGTALIDRRFSSGTYTLRISSEGESVPYRLTYRRQNEDDFDFFN